MADAGFTPVFLRNATAFGFSPRLRADIVLNNLVGHAVLTGTVRVLSDGTPWRPLVHARDIATAFAVCLTAPAEVINCRAYNVGTDRFIVGILRSSRSGRGCRDAAKHDHHPCSTVEGVRFARLLKRCQRRHRTPAARPVVRLAPSCGSPRRAARPVVRFARSLAALAATGLMVTACSVGSIGGDRFRSGGSSSGGTTTINVLYGTGTANDALFKALSEAFMAPNPDIKITLETQPTGTRERRPDQDEPFPPANVRRLLRQLGVPGSRP